mmetsp:Transcript_31965/g.76405  ORF Transcript_31965/g.76405 Transcript_31965/m.76405 type:complete len:152 (+) Transcript_31965:104-559(+)
MGNSNAKPELAGRIQGIKPPQHQEKQRKLAEQLEKVRKQEKARVDERESKHERMKMEQQWDEAKAAIHQRWMENLVLPFENMTGISGCREIHADASDDEYESDDEPPAAPAAKHGASKTPNNNTAARQKARRIVEKAMRKDYSSSEGEEEV